MKIIDIWNAGNEEIFYNIINRKKKTINAKSVEKTL
jgi:hypothetical protein